MRQETELLSQRFDGRSVATDCALGSRPETWRSPGQVRAMRNRERHVVCCQEWLHVAGDATRSSAVPHRVSLPSPTASGRHLATAARQAAPARAAAGRAQAQAIGSDCRQPNREDDGTRRAMRLRCGEKNCSPANGIWALIRWDCWGRWSSRRPVCKTATAAAKFSSSSVSRSNGPALCGPIARIASPRPGSGSAGAGS
jgi:hypothetical protein